MNIDLKTYLLTRTESTRTLLLAAGILGLVLSVFGYFSNPSQFYHSWLVAFSFWATLALGAFFFVLMHHVTGAIWSTVLRRIVESVMGALPFMLIFFIPIVFGLHTLYHWSDPGKDPLLLWKSPYLNTTFFGLRTVFYFIIWYWIISKLYRLSVNQTGEDDLRRMRRVSAGGTVIFALTFTFAAFDWLMSTDAHWYSTIYGVYIFGGAYLSAIIFVVLMTLFLQNNGILKQEITSEHYHDLGKLAFGFVIFWAYIAGSQYFLIWYGNIPEETVWFAHRWVGSWKTLSLVLIGGHFIIPFIVLIFHAAKRNSWIFKAVAVLLLVMHWVDMYWNIMPSLYPDGVQISWMDFSTMLGIGGIFLWKIWDNLTRHPILPLADPYLNQSINFNKH